MLCVGHKLVFCLLLSFSVNVPIFGFTPLHPSSKLMIRYSSSVTATGCLSERRNRSTFFQNNKQQVPALDEYRTNWLRQTTERLLTAPVGSLDKGKWHEVASILSAWSPYTKRDPDAPIQMEGLLKRLVDEPTAQVTVETYNKVLDAWACAALFRTHTSRASQRAREILVSLQEIYEQFGLEQMQPDRKSFDLVYRVVCRIEGPLVARRLLALREHLYKTGKNPNAKPEVQDYVMLLDSYTNHGGINAGSHASGLLSHMSVVGVKPTTVCYNMAIKAWIKAQKGRAAAEQADRILEEMTAEPDLITYASVISAWAASGMKAHAVARVEELFRHVEDKMEPNTVVINAVMSTWVKSRNPNAVNRTDELLRFMEESKDESCRPDLISYNTYIHALSMFSEKHQQNAERSFQVLTKMEKGYESGTFSFGPNLFSYNLVIDAFCRVHDPSRAAEVLKLLMKSRVKPDSFSFNQVLSAYSRSSIKGAYKLAEDLLRYMDEAYASGMYPKARPDVISYGSVLLAYSRSGNDRAAWMAESLLNEMKRRYEAGETHLKPSKICYHALIDSWARSGQGTLGARKAEAILQEMQKLWEDNDASMEPDIVTYNSVINAWARSNTRCCGVQAEKYLGRMWELYNAGAEKVKPNDLSYNSVISAISRSMNEGKAQRALRLLRKMDMLYRAGNKEARPNQVTYTSVLNCCAFLPASSGPKTKRKALDTAIFTLSELQNSRYGHPNEVTYGTFIKAVANLLDEDDDLRREVIERAFKQCCKDGQVGEMVLNYLRKAAPTDLYEELLAGFIRSSRSSISVKDLPTEWSCNARSERRWNKPTAQIKTKQRNDFTKKSTQKPYNSRRQF